jgi:hypothetical protein
MRFAFILLLFAASGADGAIDTLATPTPHPEDVSSADAIITALYDVISGPAGQARNFDRMRSLFLPGAIMVATGTRPDGSVGHRRLSVEEYIAASGPMLVQSGFTEREIGRTTEQFGTIMHAFSAYEATFTGRDGKPASLRGINTIQLFNDTKRWWIVSILWQAEGKEKIPGKYLDGNQ